MRGQMKHHYGVRDCVAERLFHQLSAIALLYGYIFLEYGVIGNSTHNLSSFNT